MHLLRQQVLWLHSLPSSAHAGSGPVIAIAGCGQTKRAPGAETRTHASGPPSRECSAVPVMYPHGRTESRLRACYHTLPVRGLPLATPLASLVDVVLLVAG